MQLTAKRSGFLDPTGVGSKSQFTVFGAANAAAALSKPTAFPGGPNPSNTSGVQDSTNNHLLDLTFPSYSALASPPGPGEFVNWIRLWLYFDTAIPANHTLNFTSDAAGVGLKSAAPGHPAGSIGWMASPRMSPWLDRSTFQGQAGIITAADVLQMHLTLVEGAAQAANTVITAAKIEFGISTLDHIIVEPDYAQELFATDPFAGGRATYDAGAGTLSVSGGRLVPSDTSEKRIIWTGKTMVDGRYTLYSDLTAVQTNSRDQAIFKYLGPNDYLRAGLVGGGGAGTQLVLEKVVGGAVTTLAQAAGILGDTPCRYRIRIDGNYLTIEQANDLAAITEVITTIAVLEYELTGADATKFGQGIRGGLGRRIVPHAVGERYGEHTMRARKSRLVGMSDPAKEYTRMSYAQYGSLVFDAFMTNGASAGNRRVMGEMVDRGLDMVRLFIGFGDMMTSETAVNEAQWAATDAFLDMCDDIGIRLDITGLCTFNGPNTGQVPVWLDQADGTPVLSEAARWATFGRWWKRCAQMVAAHPSVVVLDLVNEPIAISGQADYYIGSAIFYYGTFLCINRGARTKGKVFTDFMKTMRAQIRLWEPAKAIAMCDFTTANGDPAFPNLGEISAYSDISIPHMYLTTTASPQLWNDIIRDYFIPLGRPIISEEGGLTGGNQPYSDEQLISWWQDVFEYGRSKGTTTVLHDGWKGLFDDFNLPSIALHDRQATFMHDRRSAAGRIGGTDKMGGRVGQAFI